MTFTFSEKAMLTISNPGMIQQLPDRIVITEADKVLWQWFDNNKAKLSKVPHSNEFIKTGKKISGTSTVHWSAVNRDELSYSKPAVLLIATA